MVRESSGAHFYRRLKSAASAASSCPLHILPSTVDADSVCALKIFRSILNADNVRHSVFPVSRMADVGSRAAAIQAEEPVVVLLINWGGTQDLRRQLKLGPRVLVFVVDSHRPIHLNNWSDHNQQVTVLYTREEEMERDIVYDFDVGSLADFSFMTAASDGEEDEDEEESDDEEELDGGGGGDKHDNMRKRGRGRGRDDSSDHADNLRRDMRRRKKDYYSTGTFHGRAAGRQVYDISHALHINTHELLWLACVSLTDQFVHERLTMERYQSGVMELDTYVKTSGNSEMVTKVTMKDGTVVKAPDRSRITNDEEPRLMLLREWTLYDSMLCSSYVATKLKTWSDGGLKRLKLLLATMGIALVEGQQKYEYMSGETRRRMKEEFQRSSPQFGLTDLYYRSFQKLHGYSSEVSAADVVYGLTALLEASCDDHGGQFMRAYSALAPKKWHELQQGMELAIKVQRAILRQGSLAVTKQGFVKNTKMFRWFKLEDGHDVELLARPMALTKLCYFVMDALREQGARSKPLVCAIRCPQSDKALVVGVSHRLRLGAQMGNRFGSVFKTVAANLGVDFQQDGFDAAWIQTDAASVGAFMTQLSENLPK
ncbi:hypothetical protein SELMODRAFT_235830 [Selaginella moellendorffii]|uniref:Uncharacterized protein CDC45-2 n=1 Tax=Selaginella moellendorffii TaxID=88036 RepID=D8T230_SELML|nr:cell division control protein 45 homolog [Selaginella moellendorffii]EFJ09335.1 hypothetical protein SELMODRAFT_235830 [Selaginella moellendorffii]|eukprot:XP_002989665.1 cell division control protein 45 homolog [Selaginella moellendorffii]